MISIRLSVKIHPAIQRPYLALVLLMLDLSLLLLSLDIIIIIIIYYDYCYYKLHICSLKFITAIVG